MSKIQISVIVPVYNVQGYLRQCLESIISQSLDSYEVIIVDDASTDGSFKVVEEFEKKHINFSSIRLKKNRGLGNARNIGIENAKGEYIAFVDSDDYLELFGLPKALSVAKKWDCDVVIMNYCRVWFYGKRVINSMTPLLSELEPFVEGDENKARLFDIFIVAWNKIYRTDFIRANSLRNADGFYEDIPWSYPALMLAKRIGIVSDVCYAYRQRPGSILNSCDSRHLDLLKRYQEVLTSQEKKLLSSQCIKNKFLDRMLDHYLSMLFRRHNRLTKRNLIEFFIRSSYQVKQYFSKKEIFSSASRISSNRFLFLIFFYQLRLIYRFYATINKILFKNQQKFFAIFYRYKKFVNFIKYFIYRFILLKLPLNSNKAIFSSYFGNHYSCNPKYISEKLFELDPKFSIYWEVRQHDFVVPAYVKKIIIGSFSYMYHVATAKFFINNVNFPNFFQKRKKSIHIQTQHGTPLKTMGFDLMANYPAATNNDWRGLDRRSSRWDYCISSNSFSSEVWYRSFPYRYKMIECGYPRNDILFNYNQECLKDIKKKIRIKKDKKVILYVPTYREYTKAVTDNINFELLENKLCDEFQFLFRSHHLSESTLGKNKSDNFFLDVSTYPDVQELMLITDILITDYSSIMFDFAILNRPIINYIDDYEVYEKVRGMYFDIRRYGPGLVVTDTDSIVEVIQQKKYQDKEVLKNFDVFRKRFCEFENGHASEYVVRNLILRNN